MALGSTDADPKVVVPAAIEALHSRREDVCSAACFALGRMGKPALAAVPELEKRLGDRDECGAMAAWASGANCPRFTQGSPPTGSPVCQGAQPVRADGSHRGGRVAARMGPLAKDAIPALRRVSADNDKRVHAAARRHWQRRQHPADRPQVDSRGSHEPL